MLKSNESKSVHSIHNKHLNRVTSQNKKWKKNGSSLFETFNKKIESNIYYKLKKSNLKYNEFNLESLRKTDSHNRPTK